jgi:hypothetical protein
MGFKHLSTKLKKSALQQTARGVQFCFKLGYEISEGTFQMKTLVGNPQMTSRSTVCFTDLEKGNEIISKISLPKSMLHNIDTD